MASRPLWTCPKCRRRFANRNQWHSCASRPLGDHFAGKDPVVRRLFDAVERAARRHGDFDVVSNKSRIVFRSRMSSIGVRPCRHDLRGALCLARRVDDPLFTRVTTYSARNHGHEFVLRGLEDLTPRFLAYLEEACAVGRQEHLRRAAADTSLPASFWKVHTRLMDQGLLLESDSRLPSVAGVIAGGPIRGSWWSHPRGREIHAVSNALGRHADALTTKLVNGKITFVNRRLWPALWTLATSGESWQTRGLTTEARALLGRVRREGRVRATGRAVSDLERRLLVHAVSVHTDSGAHAKAVQSWEHWREEVRFRPRVLKPETARRRLESIAESWQRETGARARLPWV